MVITEYCLDHILRDGKATFGNHPYIFTRKQDTFCGIAYSDFVDDVISAACILNRLNLCGRKILLYGSNSYTYLVADTAVMAYVGVSCTVSKEWSEKNLSEAVDFLDAGAILYSKDKADVITKVRAQYPDILYIDMDELVSGKDGTMTELQSIPSDACCKIIFSSGTTGTPKAVMLTQQQMFANWESLKRRTPFTKNDKDYLFLPLSHTYAGICNFLYSLLSGMQIYLCSDSKCIMEELQMVRPTVFCTVPLILERIYAASRSQNLSPRVLFGGELRYLFSGGAFLAPEIRQYLKEQNINLLEAYGLTETSSLISCEYPNREDFESVGTVMENLEIRIDAPDKDGNGEILVRGENLFLGYFRNESATSAAFDADGFFHTGDLGIYQDDKLYLKGRKRRMILRSNGENIYPDEIEALLMVYPMIQRAKVYEKQSEVFAALYINADLNADEIIAEVNGKLPKYAQIQSYELISDSIDVRLK